MESAPNGISTHAQKDRVTYSVILYPDARKLPEELRALIFSKWLRSLRYGNDYFKLIDSESYFAAYHRYIEGILARPHTMVRFAVLSQDPDVVLGFSVCRGPTLDYVHTHKDMRRQGIGRALIPPGIDTITHLTRIGLSIWGTKPGVKFDPFA